MVVRLVLVLAVGGVMVLVVLVRGVVVVVVLVVVREGD